MNLPRNWNGMSGCRERGSVEGTAGLKADEVGIAVMFRGDSCARLRKFRGYPDSGRSAFLFPSQYFFHFSTLCQFVHEFVHISRLSSQRVFDFFDSIAADQAGD